MSLVAIIFSAAFTLPVLVAACLALSGRSAPTVEIIVRACLAVVALIVAHARASAPIGSIDLPYPPAARVACNYFYAPVERQMTPDPLSASCGSIMVDEENENEGLVDEQEDLSRVLDYYEKKFKENNGAQNQPSLYNY
jgi:hypothetical protein